MGDWWLIPVLVVLVVLVERCYTLCRRHLSSGNSSVDSSQFSALGQSEAGDGLDDDDGDDDVELHEYGLSESDVDERPSKPTNNNTQSTQQTAAMANK